jgi:hypothetical protein
MLAPKGSSAYVGISVDLVYEMVRARKIPYIVKPGNGKKVYYLIDRLDWNKWIERRKIKAVGG